MEKMNIKNLNSKIEDVLNIGAYRKKVLQKLNISTIKDLLYYLPNRYEDRNTTKKICHLHDGETICVSGRVIYPVRTRYIRSGMSLQKTVLQDDTGYLDLSWFNSPYISNQIIPGKLYNVFGKVSFFGSQPGIASPIFELQNISDELRHTKRIMPIYPLTTGVTQKAIQNIMLCYSEIAEFIDEYLPEWILEEAEILDISFALSQIHYPVSKDALNTAIYRIAFEELLFLQLGLQKAKKDEKMITSSSLNNLSELKPFLKSLPFKLTDAQKRVCKEIIIDMSKETPMNRLIQGDVGCGKTIIAVIAIFVAISSGVSCAFMAPTEILAIQHYQNIKELLLRYDIPINLLTGNTKTRERKRIMGEIEQEKAQIIVGTHSVISENVVFGNLGLVITDEQHRFGVRQRANLVKKGNMPHVLVMSATPIPRSLALVIFGDLDISVIDSYPAGRQKIETYLVNDSVRTRIYKFIECQINQGRQIYIVCPAVDSNQNFDEVETENCNIESNNYLKSVIDYADKLSKKVFPSFNVGLVHGKLRKDIKETIMQDFANNKIQILVSTTVIEVGIDVPNASVIVIENAERFGLSQLHQLRGRVGRGRHKSYCLMFCNNPKDNTASRLEIMTETNDGFVIAQKDLEFRGPGDFFGQKQHGLPELKLNISMMNFDLIQQTKKIAQKLLQQELTPELQYKLDQMFKETLNLPVI